MIHMDLSSHGEVRNQQRGLRDADLDLIMSHATEVPAGLLVLRRDVRRASRVLPKDQLQRLERLVGRLLVIDGGIIVTNYPAKRHHQRLLLRRGC